MRWIVWLIGVAGVGLAAAAAGARALDTPTGGAYAGSAACERCHPSQYASWRRTLHYQMTKPIAEATVVGDFNDRRFEAYGRSYVTGKHAGRYSISVAQGGRPAERFDIDYTLGFRRFQAYLSKRPDGRIYVLPAFWHNETKRWIDWKEITSVPNDPDHEFRQIWNVTCVNCHATNLAQNFDVASKTYRTTWTEMGIGCEACHGPGGAHIELMTRWAGDPAARPAYDTGAANRDLGKTLHIFSPRTADPRQVFDTCGYCHGNKTNVFFGFKPGDRFEDYALPFLISEPIPPNDPQGEFWPDGRPNRFNRPQAIMQTGCFQKGQATCINCHTMHRPGNSHSLKIEIEAPDGSHTAASDGLCTQCHANTRPHSHHAADSPGTRCIDCHMSDVNWRLITRRRDHTFQSPVPEMTARFGVPNACTTCHEDKAPEWAASVMDRWYGDRDRRARTVAMADAMYRAGAGDPAVLPEIAPLVTDRSHGAPIRASAAEFAGRLMATRGAAGDARTIDALVAATTDPEPMVRVTAIRSLALSNDARVASVLAMHLTDPARLARVSAAQGLFQRGVTTLAGDAATALARAQDEWAESLRTFADVADDHTTLGWLDASRGHPDAGRQELRTAIDLDPQAARPRVYLGIVEARAGRFDEALRQFAEAKRLAPNYPNIDRLIAEAQKRGAKP